MPRMQRTEFFQRAKKHGYDHKKPKGKKMTLQGRSKFRQELIDYFKSPEGQDDIAQAPMWLRDKSPEEIAELLMQEVD